MAGGCSSHLKIEIGGTSALKIFLLSMSAAKEKVGETDRWFTSDCLQSLSSLFTVTSLIAAWRGGRGILLESGARGERWESEEKKWFQGKKRKQFFFKSLDFFSPWAFMAFEFVTFTACWWHVRVQIPAARVAKCSRRYDVTESIV